MKYITEDNTVYVLQEAIRKLKIKVTDTSIREFLLTHPYYPSLKSVCDALKKWGIGHYPLKLEFCKIKKLEMPFIAHLTKSGGLLAFVEKIEKGNVFYSTKDGERKNETFEEFSRQLSGAIIVIEANRNIKEKDYKQLRQNEILNKIILPICILAVLILGLVSIIQKGGDLNVRPNLIFSGLIITKIIGITVSVLLVMHDFNIHFPFTDKICGLSSTTDCNKVLSSNVSRFFGWINWADAGLIYFIGTLIYLLGSVGNLSLGFLSIISLISLVYPLFSIYYQSVKLKKWCPLCLLIQMILITEFIILLPVFKTITFIKIDAIRLINSFTIISVLWLIYKAYYSNLIDLKSNHYDFLQFKRNPEIFTFLLKSNRYNSKVIENKNGLVLGTPSAQITVTAFLSLHCYHCAKTFKILKSLYENFHEIKVNIILSDNGNKETKTVINTLYYINTKKGPKTTLSFLNSWYSLPNELRKSLYEKEVIPEQFRIAEKIENENNNLFETCKITCTPTIFLNGYLFPNLYEYKDIEYYVENIKQLT
jgi:uncharacterized membrane protein